MSPISHNGVVGRPSSHGSQNGSMSVSNGQHRPSTGRKTTSTSKGAEQFQQAKKHAQGVSDQYSDGKAAKVWQLYIGEASERTEKYKAFLVQLLREKGCKNVLDVACGTGVDSVMLLEEGFKVVSSDASDQMLKVAYKTRWDRRKEEAMDEWEIREANWLSLERDIAGSGLRPAGGFDALVCMGNSFAHLPDEFGDQRQHRLAIDNFYRMLKPGGVLIIDHRNYDYILDHGKAPKNNIYYNSKHITDIKTSILYVNNHPNKIILDYEMDVSNVSDADEDTSHFRLTYYPHRLNEFTWLLRDSFGADANHNVFADFKPLREQEDPAFYIHTIQKPMLK